MASSSVSGPLPDTSLSFTVKTRWQKLSLCVLTPWVRDWRPIHLKTAVGLLICFRSQLNVEKA